MSLQLSRFNRLSFSLATVYGVECEQSCSLLSTARGENKQERFVCVTAGLPSHVRMSEWMFEIFTCRFSMRLLCVSHFVVKGFFNVDETRRRRNPCWISKTNQACFSWSLHNSMYYCIGVLSRLSHTYISKRTVR